MQPARDSRILGTALLVLGITGCVFGIWALLSGNPPDQHGTGCKAICGLALLAIEFLGPAAGAFVGGALWLSVGLALSLAGYRIRRLH